MSEEIDITAKKTLTDGTTVQVERWHDDIHGERAKVRVADNRDIAAFSVPMKISHATRSAASAIFSGITKDESYDTLWERLVINQSE